MQPPAPANPRCLPGAAAVTGQAHGGLEALAQSEVVWRSVAMTERVGQGPGTSQLEADDRRVYIAEDIGRRDAEIGLNRFAGAGVGLLINGIRGNRQIQRTVAITGFGQYAAIKTSANRIPRDQRCMRAVAARIDVDTAALG